MDTFDLALSPLQSMQQRWPLTGEQELRAHLGRFEVRGDDALKPLILHSGGQKSRVAFACLTFAKPHIVLMGELYIYIYMYYYSIFILYMSTYMSSIFILYISLAM
jgi:hypothetical protein